MSSIKPIGILLAAVIISAAYYYSLPGKWKAFPNKQWLDYSGVTKAQWDAASAASLKEKGSGKLPDNVVKYDTTDHIIHAVLFGMATAFIYPLVISKIQSI